VARLFTDDQSVNGNVTLTAQGITDMPYGTLAAACYHVSAFNNSGRTVIIVGSIAEDFVELFVGNNGSGTNDIPGYYNGAVSAKGATHESSGTWLLMATTKGTGTVTARSHCLNFSTGTWVHENCSPNVADSTGTSATEFVMNGAFGGGSFFDGYILCGGIWRNRAMSDSEIERLGKGEWSNYSPDFYTAFPSGRDDTNRTTIDFGRYRMRQKTNGSQVTRGNIGNPLGFRLGPSWRRR